MMSLVLNNWAQKDNIIGLKVNQLWPFFSVLGLLRSKSVIKCQ